jgi:peroxiredoxin
VRILSSRLFWKWTAGIAALLLVAGFLFLCKVAGSPRDAYLLVRYALPHIHRGSLKVGDPAPDARLLALDGSTYFHLRDKIGAKPLVLIFGSYSCLPFRRRADEVIQIYNDYKEQADFLTIYVREAHASDEWEMTENTEDGICYAQPKTLAQRVAVARDFVKRLHYPIDFGIDGMNNAADEGYAAWPRRFYVIDEKGRIAYRGGMGPYHYRPEEVRAWLTARFGPVKHDKPLTTARSAPSSRTQP